MDVQNKHVKTPKSVVAHFKNTEHMHYSESCKCKKTPNQPAIGTPKSTLRVIINIAYW